MIRPAPRHSRSASFAAALETNPTADPARRWHEVADDPNDASALALRAASLRAAWRSPIDDRIAFIVDRCRDRRVLDIGCVAHDVARIDSPNWLHGRLAEVASTCLGVDVLPDGVQAMCDSGFNAIVHDLTQGLGPIADEGPFDVLVAGEVIEHVGSIDMLFDIASQALAPGGELIVTTPNPYAPMRVWAGQRGIVWENVDHIMYAFPSGIVELAERHGLVLAEAATTADCGPGGWKQRLRAYRRRLRGRQWMHAGFSTYSEERVVNLQHWTGRLVAKASMGRNPDLLGETFVYVLQLPEQPSSASTE